jgi:hypothetical protein
MTLIVAGRGIAKVQAREIAAADALHLDVAAATVTYTCARHAVSTWTRSGHGCKPTLRVLHAGDSVVARWEFGEIPDEARPFPRLHAAKV